MSTGLLALLDDVAAIAKVAAASLDDVAAQAGKAGAKAAGVVVDDAAVTPRYVVGFDASREVPIIGRIALGSLRDKLLVLLPAALLLSAFASWLITPLLVLGGVYPCFEGAEKVLEWLRPHPERAQSAALPADGRTLEDARVAGAIKTDFILSAEIMAIALASMPAAGVWTQAAVQAVVGTLAMLWVGGGIILHGLEALGLAWPAHLAHGAGRALGGGAPGWVAEAVLSGLAGFAVGVAAMPLLSRLFGQGH
jgi:hypothetical protein